MSASGFMKLTYTYRKHSLYVGEETANIFFTSSFDIESKPTVILKLNFRCDVKIKSYEQL